MCKVLSVGRNVQFGTLKAKFSVRFLGRRIFQQRESDALRKTVCQSLFAICYLLFAVHLSPVANRHSLLFWGLGRRLALPSPCPI